VRRTSHWARARPSSSSYVLGSPGWIPSDGSSLTAGSSSSEHRSANSGHRAKT